MSENKKLLVDYNGQKLNLYDAHTLKKVLYNKEKRALSWNGDLDLSYRASLTELPDLSQMEITGSFDISGTPIKTFKGCPKKIGKSFIANRTHLGTREGESIEAFMRGFPESVGEKLVIMSMYIDSGHFRSKEEEEFEKNRVSRLQKHVTGRIWTQRKLEKKREEVSEKWAMFSTSPDKNAPEYLKAQKEHHDFWDLNDTILGVKSFCTENRTEKQPEKDQSEPQPRKAIMGNPLIQEWLDAQLNGLEQKMAEEKSKLHASGKTRVTKRNQGRMLLVKMLIVQALLEPHSFDKKTHKKIVPYKTELTKKLRAAFSSKDPQKYQGLSLNFLASHRDELFPVAKEALGKKQRV